MDDQDARLVIKELRKIRDGVEVVASLLASGAMAAVLFSGLLFPKPEGWFVWVCFLACLGAGSYIANGIRNR